MDIFKYIVCIIIGGVMSLSILLFYFLAVGVFTIAIDLFSEGLVNVYI